MKLIKEKLYWVIIKSQYRTIEMGVIADTIEDATAMAKTILQDNEYIDRIETCNVSVYRKSTKTITVEV